MKKDLNLVLLIGIAYMGVEVAYNAFSSGSWALIGKSSLWMLLVGGFTGFGLGLLNEKSYVTSLINYRGRVALGALSNIALEFLSGNILNRMLGLGIWDYSTARFNVMGQIDLLHSICWLMLTPFVFWLDDVLRHYLYNEEKPLALLKCYSRAFLP